MAVSRYLQYLQYLEYLDGQATLLLAASSHPLTRAEKVLLQFYRARRMFTVAARRATSRARPPGVRAANLGPDPPRSARAPKYFQPTYFSHY